jgi:hypothetical protein
MKHTIVYGSTSTGDFLIVAMKKSQHVPFQERHDCRLTSASTYKTQSNIRVRAHWLLSPPFLSTKLVWVIPRQEVRYVTMSLKEVYDCEVLITEIEISKKLVWLYLISVYYCLDISSGLRRGSRIFISVIFNSLLDVPKTFFLSSLFAFAATKHTHSAVSVQSVIQLNQCEEIVAVKRGLALKIASVFNRCYYCRSD